MGGSWISMLQCLDSARMTAARFGFCGVGSKGESDSSRNPEFGALWKIQIENWLSRALTSESRWKTQSTSEATKSHCLQSLHTSRFLVKAIKCLAEQVYALAPMSRRVCLTKVMKSMSLRICCWTEGTYEVDFVFNPRLVARSATALEGSRFCLTYLVSSWSDIHKKQALQMYWWIIPKKLSLTALSLSVRLCTVEKDSASCVSALKRGEQCWLESISMRNEEMPGLHLMVVFKDPDENLISKFASSRLSTSQYLLCQVQVLQIQPG